MSIYVNSEPYLKGILKIAPLSYAYDINDGDPEDFLYGYEEPLDIIDICGVNPSEIDFSIETISSDDSSRNTDLTMQRDILGRFRTLKVTMPTLSGEQYKNLTNLLCNLVQFVRPEEQESTQILGIYSSTPSGTFNDGDLYFNNSDHNMYVYNYNDKEWESDGPVKTGNYYKIVNSNNSSNGTLYYSESKTGIGNVAYVDLTIYEGNTEGASENVDNYFYTQWYLVEFNSPEGDEVIKEVFYVGDSSFTGSKVGYLSSVELDSNGNFTNKELRTKYVKNVTFNLIAQKKINKLNLARL